MVCILFVSDKISRNAVFVILTGSLQFRRQRRSGGKKKILSLPVGVKMCNLGQYDEVSAPHNKCTAVKRAAFKYPEKKQCDLGQSSCVPFVRLALRLQNRAVEREFAA